MSVEMTRYVDDKVVESSPVPSRGRGSMPVGDDQELVCAEIFNKEGEPEVFVWAYGKREHTVEPGADCRLLGILPRLGLMHVSISETDQVIIRNI